MALSSGLPQTRQPAATQQPAGQSAWSQLRSAATGGPGGQPGGAGGIASALLDQALVRKFLAELIGTAILVFFGAGMATIVFGFRAFGSSVAAGILLAGLVFGLVLTGLVAIIGPISNCHVNPAVSLAAFLVKRISALELIVYWVAQLIGALLGALLLLWVMHASPFYTRSRIGLGAQGYGRLSLLHISGGGAFLAEVILTAAFVLVVLSATRKGAPVPVAGLIMGFALALANIMGMAIDGASINPARSFGPAVVVGGLYLSQLWLFLIAPLIGGALAAALYMLFHRASEAGGAGGPGARPAMTMSAADEEEARRQQAVGGVPVAGAGVPPGTVRQGAPAAGGTGSTAGWQPAQPGPAVPGRSSASGSTATGPTAPPPEGQAPPPANRLAALVTKRYRSRWA